MNPGSLTEIAESVYQLRAFGAKVTVITSGTEAVVVDTGMRGSLGLIRSGLRALGMSLEHVSLVVLTHYHPDHSGGLSKLVEASSARVAVHQTEAAIVSGKERVPSPYRNPLIAAIVRPLLAPLYGFPVEVDYPLEDGDRLPIDEEVRVIHTPGHTAGSICLYVVSRKVLIVGDALQYRFRRLSPPAALVTRDPDQARESLKKLLSVEFETICFSHFPPLRRNTREALRRLVQKRSP